MPADDTTTTTTADTGTAQTGATQTGATQTGATQTAQTGATDTGSTTTTPPAATGAKWWEKLTDTQKGYLVPKGLTIDDPMQALPKILDIAANAEKRIGKGLDSIIDKPAPGQPYADWARANAEALGLPKDAAAYEVKPPADWPKHLPWDSAAEAAAREIAYQHGVPKAAHEAYVQFQANAILKLEQDAIKGIETARNEMRAELQRDFGQQTQARIIGAQQAMQYLAEKAGVSAAGIEALAQTMSEKTGDAGVIRIFDAVAQMMADDTGFAVGRGQQTLGMTPAEARAEFNRFTGPDGEYGKASAARDTTKMRELEPRRMQLAKLAAQ